MADTLIKSYPSYDHAASVVRGLDAAGLDADQISIIGPHDAIEKGAETGGVIGGGAGLLGALIALPIPGVGPVLAAGWLIAGTALGGVSGAAAGTLIGALTRAGLDDREAGIVAETVRRGETLVAVQTSGRLAAIADAIMTSGRPIDREEQGRRRFDEVPHPSRSDLSEVVS